MFDEALFRSLLATRTLGQCSRHFETLGSTNDYLKTAGLPFGAVITAESQTAGRGRLARAWATHPGLSLAMSVLTGPYAMRAAGFLPLACAVAARAALSGLCGQELFIKWPNDILGEHGAGHFQKLCGVLCESFPSGDGRAVICGIGVNLSQSEALFAEAGLPHAASLASLCGKSIRTEEAAAALCNTLENVLDDFARGGEMRLLAAYRQSCVTLGHEVTFTQGGKERRGRATGLTPEGALVVETDGGALTLTAGDVLVRGANGLV